MKSITKRIISITTSVPVLVTLGASATLGVLLHSAAIGTVGVLAACAFVGIDMAKAKKRHGALPESQLGDATRLRLRDPQTRAAVAAVLEARHGLERTLDESSEGLASDLAPALAQVSELDARATKLARRAEEIATYLGKKDFAALQRAVDQLSHRVLQTSDAEARALYAGARSARGDELATLYELCRTKERIAATLLSIAASLDALAAKIVRLRGLDGTASDATHDVRRDLAAMSEELASFEETLLQLNEA
jgi:hypothetical protein